jgi:hypothetical protein
MIVTVTEAETPDECEEYVSHVTAHALGGHAFVAASTSWGRLLLFTVEYGQAVEFKYRAHPARD